MKSKRPGRPLILLTNDDGYQSVGLAALERAMAPLGHLVVVAPQTQQSAIGHSISLFQPVVVERVHRRGLPELHVVHGTPSDCVKIAIRELLPRKPDLVVSGVNNGANLGLEVFYSGTVAGAVEGALFGVPSVAMSLGARIGDFRPAAAIAARLSRLVLKRFRGVAVAFNVNVPAVPARRIRGWKLTRQSGSLIEDSFIHRTDPRGRHYYWITGGPRQAKRFRSAWKMSDRTPTDLAALRKGYVSIMPMQFDLTDHRLLLEMKGTLEGQA